MTDHEADSYARIIDDDEPLHAGAASKAGCACPPGGAPPCAWCSLSEVEREQIRSEQPTTSPVLARKDV